MEENKLLEERTGKILHFIKTKSTWVAGVALALIVWLSIYIRTLNLPLLRDITTGGWTLGPDLDPFLFLRWAKYIVAHGALFANDALRYVPIGFNVKDELTLHPYMIAWFHNVASMFGSTSVEQSAVLYPVFFFAITVIAFFLLTRKIFRDSMGELKSNVIALIASFFLTILPSILPRTIAGIPEKESAGFFFLFFAFYLFLSAWKAKSLKWQIPLAIAAGITTGMMSLVWGGYAFIFVTIGLAVLVSFILGQADMNKFLVHASWLFSALIIMNLSSTRYAVMSLLSSQTILIGALPFFLIAIHLILSNTKLSKYFESEKLSKIPKPLISLGAFVILGIIAATILFGPMFIISTVHEVIDVLVTPITDRLGNTVAENRQPFFTEWAGSFGPFIKGIPILFWIFFFGSIYLFYFMMREVFSIKEKLILSLSYALFLIALIFSRYSSSSLFNGTNAISLFVYALGFIVLLASAGYYYYKYHKTGEAHKFKSIDFGLIMIFCLFFFSVVSARGAVRLIMMLVPPASIIVSHFVVAAFDDSRRIKDKAIRSGAFALVALLILLLLFSGFAFYKASSDTAKSYAPSSYTQQWQKAMSWVRNSTPTDAVFGHWWDYGYWLQTMGERATVLDGGNAMPYWDYLMGRYALTGSSNTEALNFLYSHNTTHFLIDSSDIGKYSAFSSIGSDENYDRFSWIPTFQRNNQQTQETSNSTIYIYNGGVAIDSDIIYNSNGSNIFLPGGKAGIGGIIIEMNSSGNLVKQPVGAYFYQNKQQNLPLRYAYDGSNFIDFGSGLEAGIFLFTRLVQAQNGQGMAVENNGALLYLSNRTVKSQLARLYLYKENNPNFKLVHTEDDFVVKELKTQGASNSDFVLYGDVRGPIRIWQIDYPAGMKVNQTYLQTSYPNPKLSEAR